MYSVIGGIRPQAPGCKRILFAPEPGGGLTEAETSLQTPHGLASCRWQLRGRRLVVDLQVPAGVYATVQLPSCRPKPVKAGRWHFTGRL